jgi:hypothetical protein
VPSVADSVQDEPLGTPLTFQLNAEAPPLGTLVGYAVNDEKVGGTAAALTVTVATARPVVPPLPGQLKS